MWLSNNVALPTIGADWLNAMGTTVAAAAAVMATNSRHIHSQEQWANVRLHSHTIQALQKLELLPHLWWQHQQQAHQQDVSQTGPRIQSIYNEDQHDERVTHGAPKDDSAFVLQPRVPRPAPAASSCPCNLAAASLPHQLHHHYAADDASCTIPPDMHYMGQQFGPLPPKLAQPAPLAPAPRGHDDEALLHTIPSASSLLTIRGERQ